MSHQNAEDQAMTMLYIFSSQPTILNFKILSKKISNDQCIADLSI